MKNQNQFKIGDVVNITNEAYEKHIEGLNIFLNQFGWLITYVSNDGTLTVENRVTVYSFILVNPKYIVHEGLPDKETIDLCKWIAHKEESEYYYATEEQEDDHNKLFSMLKEKGIMDYEDRPHCDYFLKATSKETINYVLEYLIKKQAK